MPRKPRAISESNIYHVVIRGADRQQMFEEKNDYDKYLDILSYYKKECQFEIYAYCLMSNHVHLLIHTSNTPLATVFRRINTRYAVWFNMKYDRTGFLQQGRYYSEPVNDERYLLTCSPLHTPKSVQSWHRSFSRRVLPLEQYLQLPVREFGIGRYRTDKQSNWWFEGIYNISSRN